jgi:hypothetical protein
MTDKGSWSAVPGQRQPSTVTPDTTRTVPNQVNRTRNRYQTLEDNDELSPSESEIDSTDSVPGLGGKVSSSSEDTDGPLPLEEIPLALKYIYSILAQ